MSGVIRNHRLVNESVSAGGFRATADFMASYPHKSLRDAASYSNSIFGRLLPLVKRNGCRFRFRPPRSAFRIIVYCRVWSRVSLCTPCINFGAFCSGPARTARQRMRLRLCSKTRTIDHPAARQFPRSIKPPVFIERYCVSSYVLAVYITGRKHSTFVQRWCS